MDEKNKFGYVGKTKEYSLSDLFNLQMGKTPSRNISDYWSDGEHKWISIADLTKTGKYISETKEYLSDKAIEESGISIIPANTVVMSFKLSIGKTAITSEDMYSNEAIMSFHDRHITQLIPDYIYYLLLAQRWDEGANKAVMGMTQNKATISKRKVRIHDINAQQLIVERLDKLQYIIDERYEQIRQLDTLIKARFVEMFGDPISNPNNWRIEQVGNHIDLLSGFPFKSDQYVDEGINICGGLIIMPQRINWNDCVHWKTTEGYEEYLLNENDIVIALDRPWISDGFKIGLGVKSRLATL